MSINLIKHGMAILLYFFVVFSASAKESPTSALEYQQATNTRIVVDSKISGVKEAVIAKSADIVQVQIKLEQKIEELTLYVLERNKEF